MDWITVRMGLQSDPIDLTKTRLMLKTYVVYAIGGVGKGASLPSGPQASHMLNPALLPALKHHTKYQVSIITSLDLRKYENSGVCVCVCVYIYIYIHTYIHTHIPVYNIYIYTHIL